MSYGAGHVYAPHADQNHTQVIKWYEELYCLVFDVHKLARFVDLVVRIPTKGGATLQLVEIKTEDGKLTAKQEQLQRLWGGWCIATVRTHEDVMRHVRLVQARFHEHGRAETDQISL
jgi:hypothetical protein